MDSSTSLALERDEIAAPPTIIVNEASLINPRSSRKPIGSATSTRYACPSRWCGDKAEVCLLEWRKLVCGVMIVIVPSSMMAQGIGRALLYGDGGTWLNGNPAPASSAIFPNDYIQTQKGHSAKIDVEGSTVMVLPETVVQFEGDELVLDHGSLQLNTGRGMKVRVGCIRVIPVTEDRTQYDVSDIDGKVKVIAYKNDVKIHAPGAARRSKQGASTDNIVHEGERATREEKCGGAGRPEVDGKGPLLNSPVAKSVGVGLIGLTCLIICRTEDPVSPSKP
jgi:hypothetical protein